MAYKFIWTNHALARLKERKIPNKLINQALDHPDKTIYNKDRSVELQRRVEGRIVAAIIRPNQRGEKIIISCWVNPPFPKTKDFRLRNRYIKIRSTKGLRKLWHIALYQLGI